MQLITGGCGFVGSALARSYLDDGEDVIIIDNLYRIGGEANLADLEAHPSAKKHLHFIRADVAQVDYSCIDSEPACVHHLAGQVAMTSSIADPIYDFNTNALATHRLLDYSRRYWPETSFLYASTNKVYGDMLSLRYEESQWRYHCPDYPDGFDESLPLDFSSPYGCSKGSADQYVKDYHKVFGLRTAVFRHSTIYGSGQKASFDQGWVGWFISQIIAATRQPGHSFTVSGNGKQVRDILHVSDVVRLYRHFASNPSLCIGGCFNVGGGKPNSISILELFDILMDEGWSDYRSMQIKFIDPRHSDQRVFVSSNKTLVETGWSPSIGYREGIKDMSISIASKVVPL